MIGKHQITIDASDFTRGMSTGADVSDGGFSPETDAVNLIANPGVLYAPANVIDCSTNLAADAIAHCPTNVANTNGFLLSTDGKILSIDSNLALTASSALTGTFGTGTADIDNFIDKLYVTSSTDVCRMDTNLTGGNSTWWSATLGKGVLTSGVRHPLQKFQDLLWIGDANALHNIVDNATGNKNVLLLNTHWEITALGVDPGSGKMLIAATQGANYSNTIGTANAIFTYDGTSATYTREFRVDGMVTGFRSVGGTTFVLYGGNKVGYWNGAGITFLRKLRNITLLGANLPYKHHTANIDNTFYVVDGKQVLAYGDVLPGRKVWYYAQSNTIAATKYGLICPVGSFKLGLGFNSAKFFTFDTMAVDTTAGFSFVTNKTVFPRPVYIRSIYFEYADAVVATEGNRYIGYKHEAQGLGFITMQNDIALSILKNTSSSSVYFMDVATTSIVNDKVRFLQLNYFTSTNNYGLRRIVIYYDVAE